MQHMCPIDSHHGKNATKEIDKILGTIQTNNITETNALIYAGAKLVTELMGKKTEISTPNQRRTVPPAKRSVTANRRDEKTPVMD